MNPSDLGLPKKFEGWRPEQERAITDMISCPSRFFVGNMPTGSGKSVCYMALGRKTVLDRKGRTVILTSTKGLQDQLKREFGPLVYIVKGKSAFPCPMSYRGYSCDRGPCSWGYKCTLKQTTCPYYLQVREAAEHKIVVANYAFWMSNEPGTIGQFALMVMDEAHDAADHILNTLHIEVHRRYVTKYVGWVGQNERPEGILAWVLHLKSHLEDKVKDVQKRSKETMEAPTDTEPASLLLQLNQLPNMGRPGNIVVDHRGDEIHIDAVSAAGISETMLFRKVPKVVMVSATLTRKTYKQLGIAEPELVYREYPSIFPVENRKVYYLPTVRMDHKITEAGINKWISTIDNIIATRLAGKGIVHAVSYDRCTRISNISWYKDVMLTHRGNAAEVVETFKRREPPCVLVSPSVGTGYDFPDDHCRWQIIGKVSFPDGRALIMKARSKDDPEYAINLAIQSLVQACGRGVRSEQDYCDTFIIDDHFSWVLGKYRHLFPKWWLESVEIIKTIPEGRRLK